MPNKNTGTPKTTKGSPIPETKRQKNNRKGKNKPNSSKKKRLGRAILKIALKSMLAFAVIIILASYGIMRYALTPVSETHDIQGSYNEMFSEFPYLKRWTDSLNARHALLDTIVYATDSTKLHALMIRAPKNTPNTAILVHGYSQNAVRMLHLAHLYNHDLRFNVLLPDLRHHGLSEGNHVQMGWKDRHDLLLWMDIANRRFGGNTRMVVHGVSMGAFSTMCLAGEPQPDYMKAYVEDCGYTSVYDIFKHRLNRQFGLPSFPILNIASQMCQWQYGWKFEDANCEKSLEHSTLPMLFIHGGGDSYVPTRMVYELYQEKPRNKSIWVAPKATHARSFQSNPKEYLHQVRSFLNMYLYK